jgi:hypothetical protein
MKRYFGRINFEFDAEDDEAALALNNQFAATIFNHPAVFFVYDELPEEDVYGHAGDPNAT